MKTDGKPVTAHYIDIGMSVEKKDAVRYMFRRHKNIWSGQLCEINVTKMRINIVPDSKPFKSKPFRAGPKTRELERTKIDKQLKSGVMEPVMSD